MSQILVSSRPALKRLFATETQRRCCAPIFTNACTGFGRRNTIYSSIVSRDQFICDRRCNGTLMKAAQTAQVVSTAADAGVAHGVSVAVIGVGLMGNKIARRLASQGANVRAWNRSADKLSTLSEAGITVCNTIADATTADVLLLTLSDAATIRETILNDAVRHLLVGKTVLQMGTIGPKESSSLASEVVSAGGVYVEAPVLGSQPEAEKGTLLIMVGADSDPRVTPEGPVWPLLCALGQQPNIHYIGQVGTAAAVKLALNQLIASLTVGFSTSLGLVQRSGAPVDKFMSILRASALYAPTYDKKLGKMLDRDYGAANFPTKHLLKDVRLFESEAAAAGLDTRLLAALRAVTQATVDRGLDNTDYSAVFDAVVYPDMRSTGGESAKVQQQRQQ
ncbi:hypothetical protein VOLCADRAFT_82085 [Volvox carteri f. nagariensis]|uniref:6-phosphogluconate dehydrogenase NADP-binding domain-containing protein n=1 Tax=Volvox carteri f. nagariensis TaxID=3068 RepID=D8U356_VOLCA|nr:uncharacterized protein VOLCADRAFT_82085 [Volvox carteri f. nagariensis]EFJ46018.1 hypothetical protein VOLCADRAFT_82085 [Volvox carteri f. nagariensis]|eukprot:XP_002953096.1 hypothetical protein VOLCADRAFT_82085 [Volvox carteri f. nagariensis]